MLKEILEKAIKTIERSYAPYSNFKVAAVLFGKNGTVSGVNVENASYGLSVCAERCAVFRAVAEGKKDFEGILIYSPNGMPYPCGACRQVLREFFPENFKVIVTNGKRTETFTLKELLPHTFSLDQGG